MAAKLLYLLIVRSVRFSFCISLSLAALSFGAREVVAESRTTNPKESSVDCEKLIDIFLPANPRHADFVMQIQYSDRLICLKRSEAVYRAFLRRIGLGERFRWEALEGLSDINESTPTQEWVYALKRLDEHGVQLDPRAGQRHVVSREWDSIIEDYFGIFCELDLDSSDKSNLIDSLKSLARDGNRAGVRRLALAALVQLDGKIDRAWDLSVQQDGNLEDLFAVGKLLPFSDAKIQLYKRGRNATSKSESIEREYVRYLGSVPGQDTEIFHVLLAALESPNQTQAVESLLARDMNLINQGSIELLIDPLVSIYHALPPRLRTKDKGKKITKLLSELSTYLPEEKGIVLRARLEGLEVAEIAITALKEQMDFDKKVFVLQAGQPVEITFHNADNMPHNLVLVNPGTMEAVGVASDQLAISSQSGDRQYVPETANVLYHTPMVEAGDTASLSFRAPSAEGVYPLLCTFPGHWLKMFAAVIVTADSEAYRAAHRTLPSREALLDIKNYEHNYEVLAKSIHDLNKPRSFDRGRAAFHSRACVSCHMVKGDGGRVGPDLSRLSDNQTPEDILRSLLYPSEKIDPKYAKAEVEHLESGKVFAGVLIPQDDPNVIYLTEDPLAECEPKVFQRSEVEISPLKVSPMPEGLLRRSSPAEVLDLVAYLISGGNPAHPIFAASDSAEK